MCVYFAKKNSTGCPCAFCPHRETLIKVHFNFDTVLKNRLWNLSKFAKWLSWDFVYGTLLFLRNESSLKDGLKKTNSILTSFKLAIKCSVLSFGKFDPLCKWFAYEMFIRIKNSHDERLGDLNFVFLQALAKVMVGSIKAL